MSHHSQSWSVECLIIFTLLKYVPVRRLAQVMFTVGTVVSTKCRSIANHYIEWESFNGRSRVGWHSIDSWVIVGQWSVDMPTDYLADYQLLLRRHILFEYWSNQCWWDIGQVSVIYWSTVLHISVMWRRYGLLNIGDRLTGNGCHQIYSKYVKQIQEFE